MDKFIATSILVHPNEVIKIYPKANIDYALEERYIVVRMEKTVI